MTDLIERAMEKEERGFGEWVKDDMPKEKGEYLVKVRATINGDTVVFEDYLEPYFEVENLEVDGFKDAWAGWVDTTTYDLVAYWDTYMLEEAGYTGIEVLAWKQIED